MEPTPSCSVYMIIQSSATLLPGSDSSRPPKPWYQLADVVPKGQPYDYPEDQHNHRYDAIESLREGRQTLEIWNVKIVYGKSAHEDVRITGWAEDAAAAGPMLQRDVDNHINSYGLNNNTTVRISYTHDTEQNTKRCEYVIREQRTQGQENVWYWWDVMEVKLEPVKQYGITNPEWEKDRVEDMEWRRKEGLDMARRSRREYTEEEKEEIEQRNKRMGIVEGEDRNDPDIMGTE